MDQSILRGLNDKIYERRKAAALELEKLVLSSDVTRILAIIDQLCGMFSSATSAVHTRNGGLIGLAATAIALGQGVGPYLGTIIPLILTCFQDPESRVRYHACESLYNIAKVSKGEILVYFNEVFDALSKLSSDSESSVKNGAELLDRLLKDIVTESALTYVSVCNFDPNLPLPRERTTGLGLSSGVTEIVPGGGSSVNDKDQILTDNASPSRPSEVDEALIGDEGRRAFSLSRFIPLLTERIYVISPYTRMHLVSWISVLDSVPDLELVAWLPDFLDGLLRYLSDHNVDVRLATENVLAEFLREIKCIAHVQEKQTEMRREAVHRLDKRESRQTLESSNADVGPYDEAIDDGHSATEVETEPTPGDDGVENDWEGEGSGAWVPGQGVFVDHAAIMDIMIQHLSFPDELVQSTAMDWILTFLDIAQSTVVSFTPRIVAAILPSLASQHRHIKVAADETNMSLFRVIQSLPLQVLPPVISNTITTVPPLTVTTVPPSTNSVLSALAGSPPQGLIGKKELALSESPDKTPGYLMADPLDISSVSGTPLPTKAAFTIGNSTSTTSVPSLKLKPTTTVAGSEPVTPATVEFPSSIKAARTRPQSPVQQQQLQQQQDLISPAVEPTNDDDPFDVRDTVNVLTLQFLSDHPETRIAALEWLLMLHLKAPDKILARDSGTFPALLKTLSDPSEDVVKHDLQLLAQISSSSDDSYFTSFMANVLELFSTDRRLLESRGSLIIRQLCLHLNAEKIFRTLAEILEKDEDLEFASMMIVKLNMILVTSPELAEFRRRLKNLDSKDAQMLFTSLYRSWSHNAVAAFSLCLLAQAYEHASNVLQIFADLELTVPLLVQIDKLVMLIESPVFTNLRLQLLEPEKYPYLSKCLYGLLMILPQSSAFVSLRARLSAVNTAGYVPPVAKPGYAAATGASRSKIGKDEIKWQELLSHFRAVQARHEKARRQLASTGDQSVTPSLHLSSPSQTSALATTNSTNVTKPAVGRRKIGSMDRSETAGATRVGNGLSPLNPRRAGSGTTAALVSAGGVVASMNSAQGLGTMRTISPPPGAAGGRKRVLPALRR